MLPNQILACPELREKRREIQRHYAHACELAKRADALGRAIDRGHIQASACDPNNTPGRRQDRIDNEVEQAFAAWHHSCAEYAQHTDELYAEHGHISRHWYEFERPEAKANQEIWEKYRRIKGPYLNALFHGTREARLNAIFECESRLTLEMGQGFAEEFLRGLDTNNKALRSRFITTPEAI